MANIVTRALAAGGLAGMLVAAAATSSVAQAVFLDPYYGGPRAYVSPYNAYAYGPGYGPSRYWDAPVGYDTGGMAYSYRELGVQPGPWTAAPSNPCYAGQRAQNRC